MVFARKADDHLASLVKKLDELIAENEDAKLSAFVNLIGPDKEILDKIAESFADDHEIKMVPIVVPVEFENGPDNFGINPDAETTVMLYTGLKVKANHALAEGKLDEDSVKAILADVPKLLEKSE
jgi:hypothetical protein